MFFFGGTEILSLSFFHFSLESSQTASLLWHRRLDPLWLCEALECVFTWIHWGVFILTLFFLLGHRWAIQCGWFVGGSSSATRIMLLTRRIWAVGLRILEVLVLESVETIVERLIVFTLDEFFGESSLFNASFTGFQLALVCMVWILYCLLDRDFSVEFVVFLLWFFFGVVHHFGGVLPLIVFLALKLAKFKNVSKSAKE